MALSLADYFDIGIVDTNYKRVNDTQERLLKLHGVLPLCPNKPLGFYTVKTRLPLGLAALVLAGLWSKLH